LRAVLLMKSVFDMTVLRCTTIAPPSEPAVLLINPLSVSHSEPVACSAPA